MYEGDFHKLAVVVLMFVMSAASAADEVYLDPQTVYIPECGTRPLRFV